MTERPTKTEGAQANGGPVHASVLVQARKDPLQRKREQRDKLIGLRDELLQESLGVIRDSMRFRDIDPELERDLDPAFEAMEAELGPQEAQRAYRVAKYSLATAAEAPIGLKLATNIAVGIMKANAAEKGAAPILNVSKVVINQASVPSFEEREVKDE